MINGDNILIADFGLARKVDDSFISNFDEEINTLKYLDPQCFMQKKEVKFDKKSDIYSLGVLFWELTSGIRPFSNLECTDVIKLISQGSQEGIIPGTPLKYAALIKKCWSPEPSQRPTPDKILYDLDIISNSVTTEFITNYSSSDNQKIMQTMPVSSKFINVNYENMHIGQNDVIQKPGKT